MTSFYGSRGGRGGTAGSGNSGGFGGYPSTATAAKGTAGTNRGGGGGGAGVGAAGGAGGTYGGGAGGMGGAAGYTATTSVSIGGAGGGVGGAGAPGTASSMGQGAGGGGGGGGFGVNGPTFTGTLTITGGVTGGNGGNGGDSPTGVGGGGGYGGVGVRVQSGTVNLTSGSITGGKGGSQGATVAGSNFQGGGRGGEAVVFTQTNGQTTLTTAAGTMVTGGAGGNGVVGARGGAGVLSSYLTLNNAGSIAGGAASGASYGGGGVIGYRLQGSNSGSIAGGAGGTPASGSSRSGGTGLSVSNGVFTNTATGTITGGAASGSGSAVGGYGATVGRASLTNQGTITGGADTASGGAGIGGLGLSGGGDGVITNSGTIRGGAGHTGGVGVMEGGGTLTNSGTIAGGAGSAANGAALEFFGDGNKLVLSTSSGTGTISGDIVFDSGTTQFDPGTAASVTLSNVIRNGSGSYSGGLEKIGSGVLVLTGADTYTGDTAVTAGVLEVDGSLASRVTVASGATFRGTGSAIGVIASASGAVFAPGDASGVGTLRIGSNLVLGSGSTFKETISSATRYGSVDASGGDDYVTVGGTLNLTVRPGAVMPVGTVFTLIHNAANASPSGTFAGQAEGSSITTGGYTFTVSYVGGTSHHDVTLTETVAPPAPVYTVSVLNTSPSQTVNDNAIARPFTGVTITDTGGGAETVTLTYTAANGQLSGAGFAHSSGSSTGTFASAADAQAAIQALVFTPTANQVTPGQTVQTTFGIGVTDTDVGVSGTGSDQVTATSVNDAPTVSGTHASSTDDRAGDALFSGVTVTDPDKGQTETATITYTAGAANGALTYGGAGGGTLSGSAGAYTLSANSAANLTAALQSLSFVPTTAPAGTPATTTRVSLSVSDGTAASATDTATVVTATHTTNTPVQAANGSSGQGIDDKHTTMPFAAVTVTDPDLGQTETATITYASANGTLSGAGAASVAGGTATYTLSASSASALQSALQAVVFTPTENQAAPGARVQTTFNVQVGDGASTTTLTDTAIVTSINDTPVLGGATTTATATTPGSLVLQPGLTVTDPDAGAAVSSARVSIGGYVAGDKLTVSSTPNGVGVAFDSTNGVLTLTGAGSDAAYQAALRSVAYSRDTAGSGSRTFTFTVTDDQSATSAPVTETVNVTTFTPPNNSGGGTSTVPSNLSAQQGFTTQLGNLTRASANDPALSDPSSPLYAQAQAEKAIAAQLDAGIISLADAQNALYHLVDGTVSVAEIDYAFFTGRTPTAAGLNYLVHSSVNPTDLNDAYYAKFSTENRYINFAANLASGAGAGAAAFQATYGSLSLADATARAYQAVFGFAPAAGKVDAILNSLVSNGLGGTETRAQYLSDITGGSSIAQKAAVVGFLLADSVKEGFGVYQQADLHFLQDLSHGTAIFNVDLLAAYTAPPALVGQPTTDATLGS